MKTIKLNLELTLPDDARVIDVFTLLAAWRYTLRGVFPKAEVTTSLPCPKTPKKLNPSS